MNKPPPSAGLDSAWSRIVALNISYGQLRAERVEATRMEAEALQALRSAQADFDDHLRGLRVHVLNDSLNDS